MSLNRFGINKQVDISVLQKASFEQQVESIADACASGQTDPLRGITENCMLGKEIPVGTGAVRIELTKDGAPSEAVMQSHIKFIQAQTLPVYNALDKRVMLQNSGEEKLHRVDTEENDETFIEEFEYTMHQQTSDLMRWSTLQEQKDLISADNAVYYDEKAITASTSATATTEGVPPSTANVSLFWEQMRERQNRSKEWIKKRVLAQKLLNDHSDAVSGHLENKRKRKQQQLQQHHQSTDAKSNKEHSNNAHHQQQQQLQQLQENKLPEENLEEYYKKQKKSFYLPFAKEFTPLETTNALQTTKTKLLSTVEQYCEERGPSFKLG
jgi:hypothetical protein